MKCGDVAESDKKFGIFPDRLKIDEIQQTRGAITSSETEDGADRRIGRKQPPDPARALAGRFPPDNLCGCGRKGEIAGVRPRSRMDFSALASCSGVTAKRRSDVAPLCLLEPAAQAPPSSDFVFGATAAVDRLFDFRR